MPLSDMQISVLVALFLAVFVLIGIYPALQRSADVIRKLVHSADRLDKPVTSFRGDAHAAIFSDKLISRQMNDFEIIVLRRLAQSGDKTLTLKQVNAPLLFGTDILHRTLRSLHRRGMLRVKVSTLLGQRFTLSETGRRYALEQGYIIMIQERKKTLGKGLRGR